MFQTNVGRADRALRIAVGLFVPSLLFAYPQSEWRYLFLLGLIPLVTGLVGTCPLYSALGLSTCNVDRG